MNFAVSFSYASRSEVQITKNWFVSAEMKIDDPRYVWYVITEFLSEPCQKQYFEYIPLSLHHTSDIICPYYIFHFQRRN